MKVLTVVKRVIDYDVKVHVKMDGNGVDLTDAKMSMNPFDKITVEGAVRLKGADVATETTAVSCGMAQCQEALRTAMVTSANRGILAETNEELRPLATARLFKALVDKEQLQLIIPDKQATDDDANQTGQILAALAGLPQVTFASKVQIVDGKVSVTRKVDGDLKTLSVKLSTVVTADLCLNEPCYVTLPNIMRAKRKQLDMVKPEDLGVDVAPHLKTLKVVESAERNTGVMVPDVATLMLKLKTEAKML